MTAKPDPKTLHRATAQLRAKVEPRRLSSDHELQRLSRVDENEIADDARNLGEAVARAEVHQRIATIRHELAALNVKIGIAASGNHRDTIRMITRALNTLERTVPK